MASYPYKGLSRHHDQCGAICRCATRAIFETGQTGLRPDHRLLNSYHGDVLKTLLAHQGRQVAAGLLLHMEIDDALFSVSADDLLLLGIVPRTVCERKNH